MRLHVLDKAMHKSFALLLVVSSSLAQGCAVVGTYMAECAGPRCPKPSDKTEYYQAVKTDITLWHLPEEEHLTAWRPWLMRTIVIVDLPISATVDTVLLPFEAVMNMGKNEPTEAGDRDL